MKPYYQDDWVTLYHGDCLKITDWLNADVLVTDPPYGVSHQNFGGHKSKKWASQHASVMNDHSTEVRDAALGLHGEKPALVFGKWSALRPSGVRELLVWDKSGGAGLLGSTDLPWGPSHEEIYVIGAGFVGKRTGSVIRQPTWNSQAIDRPNHPTPKPVPLMEYLISRCPPGVVADPFAGSGSTLIAAKAQGRKAIGVEIEERYCEIAGNRLAQDVLVSA